MQGNLDPLALLAGGAALDRAVDAMLEAFAERPFIFNLGHGILPETPIAHVERMLARVRGRELNVSPQRTRWLRAVIAIGLTLAWSASWRGGDRPLYLWLKALHVIAVIAWMAGMLYLPRLFVYHCEAEPGSEQSETFKVMERRLLKRHHQSGDGGDLGARSVARLGRRLFRGRLVACEARAGPRDVGPARLLCPLRAISPPTGTSARRNSTG